MSYSKLEFKKKEILRAGEILKAPTTDRESLWWALSVLSNFRSAHYYPMNTFQATLRKKLKSIDPTGLVAIRLKRTPSIVAKLMREEGMNLSRMQDIGGLRAVVKNVKLAYTLFNNYKNSNLSHEFAGEKDYIATPKKSGYRSLHLVFKYVNNKVPEYNKLRLEIQIRSKIQHAWATAVETLGTFLTYSLKSSEGPEEWLDFFALTSSAFAHLEGCPPVSGYEHMSATETYHQATKRAGALKVVEHLSAYRTAVKVLTESRIKGSYYLLRLNTEERTISYKPYFKEQLSQAAFDYTEMEKEIYSKPNEQVVLVSSNSIKSLKKAYPNYFLDTHEFTNILSRIADISRKS